MSDFQFLQEQPAEKELRFGHVELLQTIKSIVLKCSSPFTIGLFGRWGSGKSSIVESLRKELKNEKVPTILFDVWKHEGDALRRTFLKEVVQQLKSKEYGNDYFPTDFNLPPSIEYSEQVTRTGEIELKLPRLMPILKTLLVPTVYVLAAWLAIAVIVGKFLSLEMQEDYLDFISPLLQWGSFIGILTWFFSGLKDFVTKSEIAINKERISDPYEFSNAFHLILNNLKRKRIVIVFDNLDRVSGENAFEVISTVKTFLEPIDRETENKEVVFLVPCDHDAIKRHLKKITREEFDSDSKDEEFADEFLRKFFNTTLRIPNFYSIELEKFATDKLKETKVAPLNNDHVAWLITQVFKENPRQIIQFINVLLAHYLVFERKALNGEFGDKSFHENNVKQLTKYLLLEQKFPSVMEELRSNKNYDLTDVSYISSKDKEGFQLFLTNTSDIVITSLEPFFNFKISEEEKALTGVAKLLQHLQDDEIDAAFEYAEKIKIKEHLPALSGVIDNYIKSKNNSVAIAIFLNSLFQLSEKFEIKFTASAYRAIQEKLEHQAMIQLDRIQPRLLSNEFLEKAPLNKSIYTKIKSGWISSFTHRLGGTDTPPMPLVQQENLAQEICNRSNDLSIDDKKQFAAATLTMAPNLCKIIINHPNQKDIITSLFVTHLIDTLQYNIESYELSISVSEFEKINPELRNKLNGEFITGAVQKLLNSYNDVIKDEHGKVIFENVYQVSKLFLKNLETSNESSINQIGQVIHSLYLNSRWEYRYFMLPYFNLLYKLHASGFNQIAYQCRIEFYQHLTSVKTEYAKYYFDRHSDIKSELESDEFIRFVSAAAIQSEEYFRLLFPLVSYLTQQLWCEQFLNDSRVSWLKEKSSTINELPQENRQKILNAVSQRISDFPPEPHSQLLWDFVSGLNCDSLDTTTFENTIIRLSNSPSKGQNVFSYFKDAHFLTQEQRLKIALQVLANLSPVQPIEKKLRIIESEFLNLSKDDQNNFTHFLSEKLLLNSNEPDLIVEGSKTFQRLKLLPTASESDLIKERISKLKENSQAQLAGILEEELINIENNNS